MLNQEVLAPLPCTPLSFPADSAGDMTATTTEMSSTLPPLNVRPCSRARRANGTSSSKLSTSPDFNFRSETRRAREHKASDSMPASERRPRRLSLLNFAPSLGVDVVDGQEEDDVGGMKDLRIRTTSSSTSSSHKLSLSPSLARMRMSSRSMGRVNVCACVSGREGESGPSCTGVFHDHHISSLRHIISSPLTSMPMQSPRCAIFSTAPPSCVSTPSAIDGKWGGELSKARVVGPGLRLTFGTSGDRARG